MKSTVRSNLLPCAGLVVPPLLWAVSTQLGLILPYVECGTPLKPAVILSFAAAAGSLAAGLVSWRTRQPAGKADHGRAAYPLARPFVAMLGGLAGALFAFALALQGLSSLMLTGCER